MYDKAGEVFRAAAALYKTMGDTKGEGYSRSCLGTSESGCDFSVSSWRFC